MAGADEFIDRTLFLEQEVGDGDITAGCFVDQPYAEKQHNYPYRHRVGQMNYLGGPLMTNAYAHIERIARKVITDYGSDLHDAMVESADEMAGYVEDNAPLGPPIDPYVLRKSASPYVTDGGVETYRRPAESQRDPNDTDNWFTIEGY
jgi:hypothetical protein